jgi:hypothetical protein
MAVAGENDKKCSKTHEKGKQIAVSRFFSLQLPTTFLEFHQTQIAFSFFDLKIHGERERGRTPR